MGAILEVQQGDSLELRRPVLRQLNRYLHATPRDQPNVAHEESEVRALDRAPGRPDAGICLAAGERGVSDLRRELDRDVPTPFGFRR